MTLSVLMITYNHARFVRQAIESVLTQRTSFDYEIVVGEDYSQDGTREIVWEYVKKHPGRIRMLARESNVGMHRNFVETYQACRGQYVAILEGDDYWTCADKLQRQVNALDEHRGWVISAHPVRSVSAAGAPTGGEWPPLSMRKNTFTLRDLIRTNVIPTCSAVCRNGLVREFPDCYYRLLQGDWPFFVLNAKRGKIGFVDEVMADHRIHSAGAWSSSSRRTRLEGIIRTFLAMRNHVGTRQALDMDIAMMVRCVELAKEGQEESEWSEVLKFVSSELQENGHVGFYWPKCVLKTLYFFPRSEQVFRWVVRPWMLRS